MKIIYSNNLDGKCSAAIIRQSFGFPTITMKDFLKYDLGVELDSPDTFNDETIYIVGVPLNDDVAEYIDNLLTNGNVIIHIDNHESTIDSVESGKFTKVLSNNNMTSFYKNEVMSEKFSTSMLTWAFSCMTDTERQYPNQIDFDFSETFSHVAINPYQPDIMNEYNIPLAIRLIDDLCVSRKFFSHTDTFYEGLKTFSDEETHPYTMFWDNIFELSSFLEKIISNGNIYLKYSKITDTHNLKNAFESEIYGHKCLCLNSMKHDPTVFCDKLEEYDLVCVFHFDGSIKRWRNSFYSSEKNQTSVNCYEVAKSFGGDGFSHTAEAITDRCLFVSSETCPTQ